MNSKNNPEKYEQNSKMQGKTLGTERAGEREKKREV